MAMLLGQHVFAPTSTSSDDELSQQLIAQLLEEDLALYTAAREAEHLQLSQVLTDSTSNAKGSNVATIIRPGRAASPLDEELALRVLVDEVNSARDVSYAERLNKTHDATTLSGYHHALKCAAEEKKFAIDTEFAKRLQEADDGGEMDVDGEEMKEAERFLGKDTIDNIMAADPNSKGKHKSEAQHAVEVGDVTRCQDKTGSSAARDTLSEHIHKDGHSEVSSISSPFPMCGICMELFQATNNPYNATQSANSSCHVAFGLRLSCPERHAYCMNCLFAYIESKIEAGKTGAVVFPIRCPECPADTWGMPDEDAEKILGTVGMAQWYHQKLLDSIPRFYCPNSRCSALVQVHDDTDEPKAVCPSCVSLICVPCRTVWHAGMTCEQYQALPVDERSPEDRLVLQLAQAKNWRRCPKCQVIVELTVGCNHITCPCGTHFCFKCGSLWDLKRVKCTRTPACDLWDEDMLLAEREHRRAGHVARVGIMNPLQHQAPAAPPVHRIDMQRMLDEVAAHRMPRLPAPAHDARNFEPPDRVLHDVDKFDWIDDPEIVGGRHVFTMEMLQSFDCGYCPARLNSLADLRYHLSRVRTHPVYSCCGRFFRRAIDFERHQESFPGRFGAHVHTVRQD